LKAKAENLISISSFIKNQYFKIVMKKVLLLVLVLIFTGNIFSQGTPNNNPPAAPQKSFDLMDYGVRIEPDKRLIIVMAALQSIGVENALTEPGTAFSQKLKTDLVLNDEPLRDRMKAFFSSYKSRQDATKSTAELLAPFVSLAYAMGPDLMEPARSTDLPDDLLEVLDFAPLVREFYRKTNFEAKLPGYLKLYQDEGAKMKLPVSQMIADLLFYLNTRPITVSFEKVKVQVADPKNPNKKVDGIKTIEHERKFFIVPDLLATKGTINFRNIRDDYYAIVPPNTNFSISEARRAFLQFVIDPLVLKNANDISPLREKIKGLLDERRKSNPNVSPDVFLSVMRSLVAAIDSKEIEFQKVQAATEIARRKIDTVAQTPEAKKAVAAQLAKDKQDFADETVMELSEAYERGAVLSFYFADQLKGLENSGFNIDGSLKEMITSLDAAKEKNRLNEFAEARKRGLAVREERRKNASAILAKNQQTIEKYKKLKAQLEPIDMLIKNKEFGEADARLRKMLDEFPGESSVYYALGRVASLSAATTASGGAGTFDEGLRDKRLEDAKLFYSNAIRSATEETDRALLQLSYYNLGRIHEFYEENQKALENYQKAVAIGNLNQGGAYLESMAAVTRLSAPPKP
jgi:tetratricopeptide (TPR) repeat protein